MNREIPELSEELKKEIKKYKEIKRAYDEKLESVDRCFNELNDNIGVSYTEVRKEAYKEVNKIKPRFIKYRTNLKHKILDFFKESSAYSNLMKDSFEMEQDVIGKGETDRIYSDYGIAKILMDSDPPRNIGIHGRIVAWKKFWPDGNGLAPYGWHLHHRNPTLKYKEKTRYAKFMVNDLVMLTTSTHGKVHACLKRLKALFKDNIIDEDTANQIVKKLTSITNEEDARNAVYESNEIMSSLINKYDEDESQIDIVTLDDLMRLDDGAA